MVFTVDDVVSALLRLIRPLLPRQRFRIFENALAGAQRVTIVLLAVGGDYKFAAAAAIVLLILFAGFAIGLLST